VKPRLLLPSIIKCRLRIGGLRLLPDCKSGELGGAKAPVIQRCQDMEVSARPGMKRCRRHWVVQQNILQRVGRSRIFRPCRHIDVNGVDLLVSKRADVGQTPAAARQRDDGDAIGHVCRHFDPIHVRLHHRRAVSIRAVRPLDPQSRQRSPAGPAPNRKQFAATIYLE